MKKLLLFFIFTFFLQTIQAQNKRVLDSLQVVYKNAKHDTSKILTLVSIASQYRNNKSDTTLILAEKALDWAEKNKYENGVLNAWAAIGAYYRIKGSYDIASNYYHKVLKIREKNGDKKGVAAMLNSIGSIYNNQAKYILALQYYQNALKLQQELHDNVNIAAILNNIGNIYYSQQDFDLSLDYHVQSLNIKKIIKDKFGMGYSLFNIANIYKAKKNYSDALIYLAQALQVNEEVDNKVNVSYCFNSMGEIYLKQNKYVESLAYYEKSLKIKEELKDKWGMTYSLTGIAQVYQKQAMYDKSIVYAEKSLKLSQEIKTPSEAKEAMLVLYETYKLQNNLAKALQYFEAYKSINDSIFTLDKSKALSNLTSTMELDNKKKEVDLLAKDNELNRLNTERKDRELEINKKQGEADRFFALARQEKDKRKSDSLYTLAQKKQLETDKLSAENKTHLAENKNQKIENQKQKEAGEFQRIIIYLTLIGFASMIIFALFVYRSRQVQKILNATLHTKNKILAEQQSSLLVMNEELQQSQEEIIAQRDHIEEQNKNLAYQNIQTKQSITTALAIQKALLPFDNRVRGILKDYFVLYQPRDIVSGDFYWIEKLDNQVMVIGGDCTGHGVPGAFMSLIAINLLEKIVLQDKITSPSQILRNLHDLVRSALKQDEIENNSGMDLGIVTITDGNKLSFSGAKRPLYFIDSSNPTEVRVYGGSRKSIGGLQNEAKEFEEVMLVLPADSMFYLSSDGLADQNNMKRKRLKEEPVLEVLLATYKQPLENQRLALSQLLENHMIGTEQRDDILLLGIKI